MERRSQVAALIVTLGLTPPNFNWLHESEQPFCFYNVFVVIRCLLCLISLNSFTAKTYLWVFFYFISF